MPNVEPNKKPQQTGGQRNDPHFSDKSKDKNNPRSESSRREEGGYGSDNQ